MKNKINNLIENVGSKFKENNLSLVTAESCSGGGLAFYFTRNPECSSILERGFITYSNQSKESILKVGIGNIQLKGVVSKVVAIEMAVGALNNSQAQVSIATTGIASEDRGKSSHSSKKHTSGIVWICCADIYGVTLTQMKEIQGSRNKFIETTIIESLNLLKKYFDIFEKNTRKSKLLK